MKIAFLIVAHSQPNYLGTLLTLLQHKNVSVYVHINPIFLDQFQHIIAKYQSSSIQFFSQYKIHWGGRGLIDVEKLLLSKAYENEDNKRFIFMTGSDIICKPIQTIIDFFNREQNKEYQFIQYFKLPVNGWGGNGGMDRLDHYHLFDIININRKWARRLDKLLNMFQTMMGIHRLKSYENYYGGEGWWNINRDGANILLDHLNDKNIMKSYNYTFAADEILPQTVLANQPSLKLCNKTFRYQDWTTNPAPGIITERHLDKIKQEDIFFTRKIDENRSEKIIEYCIKIQQHND